MPMPSWPGMNGGEGLTGQSPWAAWMSVWQSPDVSIRTTISAGPATGFGTCLTTSCFVNSSTTAAFIVPVAGVSCTWACSLMAMEPPSGCFGQRREAHRRVIGGRTDPAVDDYGSDAAPGYRRRARAAVPLARSAENVGARP